MTFIRFVFSALITTPSISPAMSRFYILQRMSCNLCDSKAESSAYSRSSSLLIRCHWIPLNKDPNAFLVTQSRVTRNKRGETRQPCLTPVNILTGSVSCPICTTCAVKSVKGFCKICMKPIYTQDCYSTDCSTMIWGGGGAIWSTQMHPFLNPT